MGRLRGSWAGLQAPWYHLEDLSQGMPDSSLGPGPGGAGTWDFKSISSGDYDLTVQKQVRSGPKTLVHGGDARAPGMPHCKWMGILRFLSTWLRILSLALGFWSKSDLALWNKSGISESIRLKSRLWVMVKIIRHTLTFGELGAGDFLSWSQPWILHSRYLSGTIS